MCVWTTSGLVRRNIEVNCATGQSLRPGLRSRHRIGHPHSAISSATGPHAPRLTNRRSNRSGSVWRANSASSFSIPPTASCPITCDTRNFAASELRGLHHLSVSAFRSGHWMLKPAKGFRRNPEKRLDFGGSCSQADRERPVLPNPAVHRSVGRSIRNCECRTISDQFKPTVGHRIARASNRRHPGTVA